MSSSERLQTTSRPSCLKKQTRFDRTPISTQAGLVAGGAGEIILFNETYLGLAAIAVGAFAGWEMIIRKYQNKNIREGVKNNV